MIPTVPTEVSTAVLLAIKLFALLGLLIYVGFAAVMVRQEQLMAKVLESSSEKMLRILVSVHLLLALILFGLAFVLL